LLNTTLPVDAALRPFTIPLELPSGEHVVRLECDAQEYRHPERNVVFAVFDFQVVPDELAGIAGCRLRN
jgi:hypothetical protein